ncbi:MAG: ExbD/TolR family protein [Brevinema sp.]
MFKKYRSTGRIQASISMTPMIDVVFLLLIFFMVTSTYIQTSSLNVDLPKAQTSDTSDQHDNTLVIYQNGSIEWNGASVDWAELSTLFRNLKAENPNVAIVIQGDQDVPYQSVVQAMDAARVSGIERLSLATVVKK